MNAYKFNSTAQTFLRYVIFKQNNVPFSDIYKYVKDLHLESNIIETNDGKFYKVVLEEIKI